MRLLRLLQLVDMLNAQLQLLLAHHVENVTCALLQFFARSCVMQQGRSGQKQGSLLRKLDGIKRRHRAARASKEHQVSARTKNIEVLLKSALAYSVIDYVDTLAISEPLRLR